MSLNIIFQDINGKDIIDDEININLNITHNLNKVCKQFPLSSLGFTYYHIIWRADEYFQIENGKIPVNLILPHLIEFFEVLYKNEDKAKLYLPSNGWGTMDSLYSFLLDYIKACLKHRNQFIHIYR